MSNMDEDSNAATEATPQPEGPPKLPTQRMDTPHIWEDDNSLPSLPPVPSPALDYSDDSPLGVLVDTSLFSDKSLEDRLHRTLNRAPHPNLPTLEVARLVQQVHLLRETNQELRRENKRVGELVEARMTAELREREARQECVALKQERQQSDKEMAELRAEVAALQREKNRAVKEERASEQASEQARKELSRLQSQNASVELEKNDLAKELGETKIMLAQAQADIEARLTMSAEAGIQTDSLHVETKSCQTEALQRSDSVNSDRVEALVSEAVNRIVKQDDGHFNSIPIGERLCRIRDAADRASLVKEHQREISRLMAEHECERNLLQEKFEKEKDKLLEDAMAEMNAGYKGLRRRIEKENDKKMQEMDRLHRQEVKCIREEADSATATAAESFEVALAQVASTNHRCQKETKKREALDRRLEELQKEFDSQKRTLEDKLGNGWDEERRSLVELLQRECNGVFDRSKSTISPRSVSTEFFADIQLAEKQQVLSPQQIGDQSTSEVVSLTFSELDRTLRETEALVEMVLNGNSRV